jgi:hypothetical protein
MQQFMRIFAAHLPKYRLLLNIGLQKSHSFKSGRNSEKAHWILLPPAYLRTERPSWEVPSTVGKMPISRFKEIIQIGL